MLEIDTTNLNLKMNIIMDKLGDIVKQEAIYRCPQEYGILVASIEKKVVEPFTKETEGVVEIGTNATDSRGKKYASYVEYGTGPMVAAHGEHPNLVYSTNLGELTMDGLPVTKWDALKKRNEEGLGQTMPFMRTAAFVSDQPIEQLFKEAFH